MKLDVSAIQPISQLDSSIDFSGAGVDLLGAPGSATSNEIPDSRVIFDDMHSSWDAVNTERLGQLTDDAHGKPITPPPEDNGPGSGMSVSPPRIGMSGGTAPSSGGVSSSSASSTGAVANGDYSNLHGAGTQLPRLKRRKGGMNKTGGGTGTAAVQLETGSLLPGGSSSSSNKIGSGLNDTFDS